MITLKDNFKKGRRQFRKLFKNEKIDIFQVTMTFDTGGKDTYMEVFKPTVRKPNQYHQEAYEKYPSDAEWGIRAWTITTQGSLKKILGEKFKLPDEVINKICQICQCVTEN